MLSEYDREVEHNTRMTRAHEGKDLSAHSGAFENPYYKRLDKLEDNKLKKVMKEIKESKKRSEK